MNIYIHYVKENNLYDLYQVVMNFLDDRYGIRNAEIGLIVTYVVKEVLIRYGEEKN